MAEEWTEAEIKDLINLWADGIKTSKEIADNLNYKHNVNRNRNAVIGKAWRLGLKRGKIKAIKKIDLWTPKEKEYLAELWKDKDLLIKDMPILFKIKFGRKRSSQSISAKAIHDGFLKRNIYKYKSKVKKTVIKKKIIKPTDKPIYLNEIKDGMCRYIIGEPKYGMCCGHKTNGTYCDYHNELCYRKAV